MEDLHTVLPFLLGLAWLLPLASFTLIVLFGPRMGAHGVAASYLATGAIGSGFLLSVVALLAWGLSSPDRNAAMSQPAALEGHGEHADASGLDQQGLDHHGGGHHAVTPPRAYSGEWYTLGRFGKLKITIGYYIDALTIGMFAMVTLIATCIHFYAIGYMHDELHDVTDHEVTLSDGQHLRRPGRFHRFFQYMSLFCFSMLGLVIAGNIAMVFVFWELVGICSYFLIGFYIERKSASNAANKAFIVNRVGDFGMIIGLMALFASLGTFAFGDGVDDKGKPTAGIFSQVRAPANHYALQAPASMVRAAAAARVRAIVADHFQEDAEELDEAHLAAPAKPARKRPDFDKIQAASESEIAAEIADWREQGYGYWLLVIAGVGIFCGCVGKSAQFPLHVWLPDAMEGPTPVSALVHSATMVAAGVYLVGRFYPVFAPEVLLVIAYTGAITLLLAATIALTATDIKRVLAYSTVSQLGYMMLALGVGGWAAGMFHLITHAFFKSLLFLCSGSVIHACHTNEMPKMGGLLKKMPITGYTMLVGCLAIMGAGVPFLIGLSGYYSKDSIIAQAISFQQRNPAHGTVFFYAAAGGAAMTAFYMFRLWYMTFLGPPRDHHIHEHAHESPTIMYAPLIVLAVFAAVIGWPVFGVTDLLEQARPAGETGQGVLLASLAYPNEHDSHAPNIHMQATLYAFSTALGGFLLATVFYGVRWLNPNDVRQQFGAVYRFLLNKWYFDELYDAVFVRPARGLAKVIASFDRLGIDRLIDNLARWTRGLAGIDDLIDRYLVDGAVNLTAGWTYSLGRSLRSVQTGKLRQYVMLIVIGTVALTILINFASAK
ncbi:MAG TPA: NADH-quinone oxidoreductase subunit L [Pirellulales bacterium]|nr:NADH-quinone oxidoreductase subunit L [Pirellulales bacterium]